MPAPLAATAARRPPDGAGTEGATSAPAQRATPLPAPMALRPLQTARGGPPAVPVAAVAPTLHIGHIQLQVRQPPPPPPRVEPRRSGTSAAAAPAFSSHRHYLRGL